MIEEKFDAIVVGAGMSGNAAAYTLASRGLKVLQLERGEYAGSKNVQGAIMYADMLEKIVPNFREDAPLERSIVEQRFWMMDDTSHTGMHYRSDDFNNDRPNRYTIVRAQFDKWFSRKVREAGATVLTETTVTELVQDAYGKVIGVRTDRRGGQIHADVVVLAEGVNGLLRQPRGLAQDAGAGDRRTRRQGDALSARGDDRPALQPQGRRGLRDRGRRHDLARHDRACLPLYQPRVDLGRHRLPGLRFRTRDGEPLRAARGVQAAPVDPPPARRLGGQGIRAHLIPRAATGRSRALRRRLGHGGRCGAAQHAIQREGSNLAIPPADRCEAIFQVKSRRDAMTKENLQLYKKMLDESFVIKDLKKQGHAEPAPYQFGEFLHDLSAARLQAAQSFLHVDGTPKLEKEKETTRAFIKARRVSA